MWAVTRDLEIKEKVVIADGKRVVACSDPVGNDKMECYSTPYNILRFLDTEQDAVRFRDEEIRTCRETFPKVRAFIEKMSNIHADGTVFQFDRSEYLGIYADRSANSYYNEYKGEQEYASKLGTYIKSGMLNLDGMMIPRGEVVRVKWFKHENTAEYDPFEWLAELTLRDDTEVRTGSEQDVRLVWAVLGKCSDIYYIDNDFAYDKNDDE